MHPSIVVAATALLLFGPSAVGAEDGRLLSRVPITVTDEDLVRILRKGPELRRARTAIHEIQKDVVVESITYLSDGLRVRGYLAIPRSGTDLPCVIFNRGGNREFGALTPMRATRLLGTVARQGYVVVASQYRGVDGGEGREEFGGAEIADVLNLLPLLDSVPQADSSRVGIYGWSRGGMMTYLALTKTDRFRAAVVGAGVSDSFDTVARRPEMESEVYSQLVPNWEAVRESALEARSAIRWPDKLHKQTPILLLHGSSDWRVHPSQALRMSAALFTARHPHRLVFFEGGDHGLTAFRSEVDRLIIDWLNRYVRDGKSWPSLEPHGR